AGSVIDSVLVIEVRSAPLPDSTYYAGQAIVRLVRIKPNVLVVPEELAIWPTSYPLTPAELAQRQNLFTPSQWAQVNVLLNNPPGLLAGGILEEDSTYKYQVGQLIVSKGEGFSFGGRIERIIARNGNYVLVGVRLLPLEEIYDNYPFPNINQMIQQGLSPINPNDVRFLPILNKKDSLSLNKFIQEDKKKPFCKPKIKPKLGSTRAYKIGLDVTVSAVCEFETESGTLEIIFSAGVAGGINYTTWYTSDAFYILKYILWNHDIRSAAKLIYNRNLSVVFIPKLEGEVKYTIKTQKDDLEIEGITYIIPIPGMSIRFWGYWAGVALSASIGSSNVTGELVATTTPQLELFSIKAGIKGSFSLNLGSLLYRVLGESRGSILNIETTPYAKVSILDVIKISSKIKLDYYETRVKLIPFTFGPMIGILYIENIGELNTRYASIGLGINPYASITPLAVSLQGAVNGADASKRKSRISLQLGGEARLLAAGDILDWLGLTANVQLWNHVFFEKVIGNINLSDLNISRNQNLIAGKLGGYSSWANEVALYRVGSPAAKSQPEIQQTAIASQDLILLGQGTPQQDRFQFTYDASKLDCGAPEGGKAHLVTYIRIPVLGLFTLPLGFSYLREVDLCNPEFRIQPPHLEFTGQKGDRLQQTVQAIAKDAGTVTVSVSNTQGPFTLTPTQATITPPDSTTSFTVQTECTDERLGQRLTGSATFTFTTSSKQVQRTLSLSLSCQDADNPNDNPPIAGDRPPARGG
ncbi:hypothetical protein, partial [Rhodothermus profundi]